MGLIKSFYYAHRGIIYILLHERNARIHLFVAAVVLAAGAWLGISNAELAAIFFAIILVFLAEVVNSAFEKTLDIINPEHSHEVRIVKDMAAAAVLVASVGAGIVGVAVLGAHFGNWRG